MKIDDLQKFEEALKKDKFWNHYEVRSCLWKENDVWKVCVLQVILTNVERELTIWKDDHFQLAVESYDITTFDNFLTNLKKNELYINQQIVSLKSIDGEFTYDFKPRKYSFEEFRIDYGCHVLTCAGKMIPNLHKEITKPKTPYS